MDRITTIKQEELGGAGDRNEDLEEQIDENILQVNMDQSELEGEQEQENMEDSSDNNVDHEINQTDFISSDSSSEDENEEQINKDRDSYVNVVGKKITQEDLIQQREMKQNMKEFFMKCSPDVSFSTLVQFFIRKLPEPKPIYVLASDVCPKNIDPDKKYAIVCAVSNCENAYIRDGNDWENIEQTLNFFGFPTDTEQCKKWIESIGRLKYLKRNSIEILNYRVCEIHFANEDFTSPYKDALTSEAVPSLFLTSGSEHQVEIDEAIDNEVEESQENEMQCA